MGEVGKDDKIDNKRDLLWWFEVICIILRRLIGCSEFYLILKSYLEDIWLFYNDDTVHMCVRNCPWVYYHTVYFKSFAGTDTSLIQVRFHDTRDASRDSHCVSYGRCVVPTQFKQAAQVS